MELRAVGMMLATLLLAGVAQATPITIDPDDYATGTDLSAISPYVNLTSGRYVPVIAANFDCGSLAAPSGDRVFGLSNVDGCHGWSSQAGGPYPAQQGNALVAAFNQDITDLTLSVLNVGYAWAYAAEYVLYDVNMNVISSGFVDAPLGEVVDIYFNQSGIRYLQIGGLDSIAALAIDKLSFNVPEPATLLLMSVGLLMLGYQLRRRAEANCQTL